MREEGEVSSQKSVGAGLFLVFFVEETKELLSEAGGVVQQKMGEVGGEEEEE